MKPLLIILIVLLLALNLGLGILAYQVKGRLAQVDTLIKDGKAKMAQAQPLIDEAKKTLGDVQRIAKYGENKLNELNGEIGAQRKEFEGLKKAVSLIGVGK